MTLGEKVKEARKQCRLSQEQLADKMNVSRSAVAKWETDKGIPDVDNLKALSQLLNVSVDYLLEDGAVSDKLIMREAYNLSEFGKGIKKTKKDRVIREKFPDYEVYNLMGEQKLTKGEKIFDNVLGFLSDAPFGIPDFINGIKNLDKEFYLAEKDNIQFFIIVTDEYVITRRLEKHITDKKFEIDNWIYTKCGLLKVKE